jgi:hypothetical protein
MKLFRLLARVVTLAAFSTLVAQTGAAKKDGCDRQLVMQIDSAYITVEADGITINAFGVSESAGWSVPTLVAAGSDKTGIEHVDFVACRPEVSAQVLTPIQTKTKLSLGAEVRQIVVRTKTNSMTVEITRR